MPTHKVELTIAAEQLPELVEEAIAGAEVVITRDLEPLVRLVPASHSKRPKRMFGSARGQIHMTDDFDAALEDFREYT
jgi:prevent-host-death family protein